MMKPFCAYIILTVIVALTLYNQFHLLNNRFSFSYNNPYCSWCQDNEVDEVQFIPTDTLLIRLFAPADPDFAADLIWLRTAYYFGAHAITDQDYSYLTYLLLKITDLAPNWDYPYLFGGIVLFIEAKLPNEALILIEKGLRNKDDNWQLYFLKGYIHWKAFEDYEQSSKYIFMAAQKRGAPVYLANLSISLAKSSGKKTFTEAFYRVVLSTVKNPKQKQIIQKKIKQETLDGSPSNSGH
jgi:hypothetical protein